MSEPFVSVDKVKGVAVVKVRIGDKHRHYPLTKVGCRTAGKELFEAGAESWMNSSSVDFPHEVKRGFRHDVHELMTEGFRTAMAIEEAPRKSMVAKMMTWCASDDFQATLTEVEQTAFVALVKRVETNA